MSITTGKIKLLIFLKDDPINKDVNFIITNPPWSQNKNSFKRVISLNLSFAFLVRVDVVATKYFKTVASLSNYRLFMIPISDRHPFINEETGKDVQVGKVCWLVGLVCEDNNSIAPMKVIYDNIEEVFDFKAFEGVNDEDQEIVESIHTLFY